MQICLKYARMFWVVAILMMACGQMAHAYQDSACAIEHASERKSPDTKQQPECPSGHKCCTSHSHIIGALHEAPKFNFVSSISSGYIDRGVRDIEAPVQEIEYPPQLS